MKAPVVTNETLRRPIYVAARVVDYDRPLMHTAERWLHQALPGASLAFARGRYRDAEDWLRRWPRERDGYGGIVLATWSPLHSIGLGMARELADMQRLGRPVLWLRLAGRPAKGGGAALAAALVDRFRIGTGFLESLDDIGRIEASRKVEPFAPKIAREVLAIVASGGILPVRQAPGPALIIPGTAEDFAARCAEIAKPERPLVYLTSQFDLGTTWHLEALNWLRRQLPDADIIAGRGLYQDIGEWEQRWPLDRTLYAGAVILTAPGRWDHPDAEPADPSRPAFHGGHEVPPALVVEIDSFVRMRRPVAWLAYHGTPTMVTWQRWVSRFAVANPFTGGLLTDCRSGGRLWPIGRDAPGAPSDFVPVVLARSPPMRRKASARPCLVANRER